MLCAASSDEQYVQQWGRNRFDDMYTRHGLDTIWGWAPDSGLRPCSVYLRHCALAAERLGPVAHASFLDGPRARTRIPTPQWEPGRGWGKGGGIALAFVLRLCAPLGSTKYRGHTAGMPRPLGCFV